MRDPLDLSDVPAANKRAMIRALVVLALFVAWRQAVKNFFRASFWRIAGWCSPRWKCELCLMHRARRTSRFCRTCWDGGLAG